MIRVLPVVLFLFGCASLANSQEDAVRFWPPVVDVVRDSTGYVQTMISVYSVDGDSVRLTSVQGSCKCANGTVQRPVAVDTTAAKIYLAINAKHFVDPVNYVDYTIHHTGSKAPSHYRVIVRVDTTTH